MSWLSKGWKKFTGELSTYDPSTKAGRLKLAAGALLPGSQFLLGGPKVPGMEDLPNYGQDPFDVMVREAALNSLRSKQRGDRMASFYTGPRGLQGPAKTVLG